MMVSSQGRVHLVGYCFSLVGVLMLAQLFRLQIFPQRDEIFNNRENGLIETQKSQMPRGSIYDRWGHLLAGNQMVYEVGVELYQVDKANSAADIARFISQNLDMDYQTILDIASIPPSLDAVHAMIRQRISGDQYRQLKAIQDSEAKRRLAGDKSALNLTGLVFTPYLVRGYAESEMASNVIGFVALDNAGHLGVEEYYNDLLTGRQVQITRSLSPVVVNNLEYPQSADLILTIDREVQSAVEEILDQAVEDTGSLSGSVLILDPRTGEILAMATSPRLNLNDYWNMEEANLVNRNISQPYEPGSVFKVLTMASALDLGVVTPETTFVDEGSITVGGIGIHNWNGGAWGLQDMQGCMQHSLNVCLAWVATQVGASQFAEYMQAFGIGHVTGVDLADEVTGRLKLPSDGDWHPSDLGRNAFGHSVSTTPLQMAVAVSAVANQGVMMAPHILKAVVNQGVQYETPLQQLSKPISAQTADTLTEMLTNSLVGESSLALVPGYRLAGKTGTANAIINGKYSDSLTNASFIGWGPVDDPQFLVYVWLEQPKSDIWGSTVAAPVFRDVVQRLVIITGLPPDDVRHELSGK